MLFCHLNGRRRWPERGADRDLHRLGRYLTRGGGAWKCGNEDRGDERNTSLEGGYDRDHARGCALR